MLFQRRAPTELLYQLEHDNVIGQQWAASQLEKHDSDPAVRSVLEALSDD